MTLAIRPTDAAPLVCDVPLARRFPDAPHRATDQYLAAVEDLRAVWPCEPNEERVRYYVWASRQLRDCQAALERAWDALHAVQTLTTILADDLDAFARTGRVPVLEDEDMNGVGAMALMLRDQSMPPTPTATGTSAPLALPSSEGVQHGTLRAYKQDKCRCEACTQANRAYMRDWRADKSRRSKR